MRKSLKRACLLFLSTAVAVTTLSGCVGSKQTVGKEVNTVTIWSSVGSSKAFWENKIEEFNNTIGKEKGINIVFEASTDASYGQRLKIAMQSDDLPDIFDGAAIKELIELDRIVPLDDLDGMKPLIEKYKDYLRENVNTKKGKTYSLISGVTTRGLIYNKDMFKAAGIVDEKGDAKPPKTFDELREVSKKLTNESKMQYGIIFPLKWQSWVNSDVLGMALSSTGLPECYDPVLQQYDYSVLKPILKTYLDMKSDKSVYPGAESLDNDPARARFADGGIGMKMAYSFDVGVLTSQFPAQFDWGVAPLPVLDANNAYKQTLSYGWGMRVSKKGIERCGADKIAEVMKWWYSDDNYRELYKEGLESCPDFSVIKDIELDDSKAQWKQFCEMQEISTLAPPLMPKDVSGKITLKEIIVDKIWSSGGSLDLLDDYTKIANEGIIKYKGLNPDVDYSLYTVDQWNPIK